MKKFGGSRCSYLQAEQFGPFRTTVSFRGSSGTRCQSPGPRPRPRTRITVSPSRTRWLSYPGVKLSPKPRSLSVVPAREAQIVFELQQPSNVWIFKVPVTSIASKTTNRNLRSPSPEWIGTANPCLEFFIGLTDRDRKDKDDSATCGFVEECRLNLAPSPEAACSQSLSPQTPFSNLLSLHFCSGQPDKPPHLSAIRITLPPIDRTRPDEMFCIYGGEGQ